MGNPLLLRAAYLFLIISSYDRLLLILSWSWHFKVLHFGFSSSHLTLMWWIYILCQQIWSTWGVCCYIFLWPTFSSLKFSPILNSILYVFTCPVPITPFSLSLVIALQFFFKQPSLTCLSYLIGCNWTLPPSTPLTPSSRSGKMASQWIWNHQSQEFIRTFTSKEIASCLVYLFWYPAILQQQSVWALQIFYWCQV